MTRGPGSIQVARAGGGVILPVKEQQFQARRCTGEDTEVDTAGTVLELRGQLRPVCDNCLPSACIGYFLPSCSLAAATTRSGSKPNFLWSSLSGADAPNVFMPMTWPRSPT